MHRIEPKNIWIIDWTICRAVKYQHATSRGRSREKTVKCRGDQAEGTTKTFNRTRAWSTNSKSWGASSAIEFTRCLKKEEEESLRYQDLNKKSRPDVGLTSAIKPPVECRKSTLPPSFVGEERFQSTPYQRSATSSKPNETGTKVESNFHSMHRRSTSNARISNSTTSPEFVRRSV